MGFGACSHSHLAVGADNGPNDYRILFHDSSLEEDALNDAATLADDDVGSNRDVGPNFGRRIDLGRGINVDAANNLGRCRGRHCGRGQVRGHRPGELGEVESVGWESRAKS